MTDLTPFSSFGSRDSLQSYNYYSLLEVDDAGKKKYFLESFNTKTKLNSQEVSISNLKSLEGSLKIEEINGGVFKELKFGDGIISERIFNHEGNPNAYMKVCFDERTEYYRDWYSCTAAGCTYMETEYVGSSVETVCFTNQDPGTGGGGTTTTVVENAYIEFDGNQEVIIQKACPSSFQFATVGNGLVTEVTGIGRSYTLITSIFNWTLETTSFSIPTMCITLSGTTNQTTMRNEISNAMYLAD